MQKLRIYLFVVAIAVSLAAATPPDQGQCPGAEQGCIFDAQYWQEGPNSYRLINGTYGVSYTCILAPMACTWAYVYCPQWGNWQFVVCRQGMMCNIANNCYGPPPIADEATTKAAMEKQRAQYAAKAKASKLKAQGKIK